MKVDSFFYPSLVLVNREALEQRAKSTAPVIDLKPLPMEKMTVDRIRGKNGSLKRVNSTISATPYTVATLQTATNSFCQENLVGEGSIGRVYRADFPNGKVNSNFLAFRFKLSIQVNTLHNLISSG